MNTKEASFVTAKDVLCGQERVLSRYCTLSRSSVRLHASVPKRVAQKPNLIIVLLYIERTQKLGSHVSASSLTASNTNRAKMT